MANSFGPRGRAALRGQHRLCRLIAQLCPSTTRTISGRQLRAMYDDLLQEPIPGRFLALIARLERQEREQSHGR
jgi:hypothetical protein